MLMLDSRSSMPPVMKPVYLSRRSAWQYLGIGNRQGIGSKDYPEKPRISPLVDVFPIMARAKF